MREKEINMTGDKQEVEKQTQKVMKEKFNNITQKDKVENQNQEHNVKKEGIGPKNAFH